MFLKTLGLKNFRSFDAGEVELQKDLTVFVGENNGGKSNAIDAIRLVTQPLGGRREIYCEPTDVRFQSSINGFELEAVFSDLSAGQQGRMISASTDASMSEARFGIRYNGSLGDRPSLWAGKLGSIPEPGCHDMVRHVYLQPLRDAKRALASGNPTRIMALLNHFLGETKAEDLARELARQAKHDVLTKVDEAVGKGLTALTAGVRPQAAALGFAPEEALVDIARDLRFKLADHGVYPEDLRYSGHGYANLLFMATIAVELENVRNADLTLFLVEEPEAHLHPQLQAAVLSFLKDHATLSRATAPESGPAGQIQVVVASHSPNLSAWVSSKQLVVFKSVVPMPPATPASRQEPRSSAETDTVVIEGGIVEGTGDAADTVGGQAATTTAAVTRRSTRCIPLSQIDLDDLQRRKIDRYLDVTKAALLFGGRVLLVEGIAEALLLPVIAEHFTLKGQPDKLRLFRSTVFVPIDGVDFVPYANLLTRKINDARIAERVVVMTDGDHGVGESKEEEKEDAESAADEDDDAEPDDVDEEILPGERRKRALDALAKTNGAEGILSAITSRYSLESELLEAGNTAILRAAYVGLHKRSGKKWDKAAALKGDVRAKAIQGLFKNARKGDFAQVLADLIEKIDQNQHTFVVPKYIDDAIREVVA